MTQSVTHVDRVALVESLQATCKERAREASVGGAGLGQRGALFFGEACSHLFVSPLPPTSFSPRPCGNGLTHAELQDKRLCTSFVIKRKPKRENGSGCRPSPPSPHVVTHGTSTEGLPTTCTIPQPTSRSHRSRALKARALWTSWAQRCVASFFLFSSFDFHACARHCVCLLLLTLHALTIHPGITILFPFGPLPCLLADRRLTFCLVFFCLMSFFACVFCVLPHRRMSSTPCPHSASATPGHQPWTCSFPPSS